MTTLIQTTRLNLVPMSPAFLRFSIDRNLPAASREIGLSLPTDWPQIDEVLALRLDQLERDPALQPWLLRAISLKSDEMVGHIGFHTAPGPSYLEQWMPGGIEFGFTVFAPYRRRGYAREASLALMDWASNFHGVKGFVLTVKPDNLPSRCLAVDLGFSRIGDHIDEIDGVEDVFSKSVPGVA